MPAPRPSRRDVLRAAALAAVAGPRLAPADDASARRPMRVSVQLYSVRGDCAKDFDAALAAVAKMGFEGVEFAGYHGYKDRAADLKKRLGDLGLAAAGTHIPTASLRGDALERTIEFHRDLGCPFLIVPGDGDFTHPEKSKALAETFNAAAEKLAAAGMACGYHNHQQEFGKDGDKTWWDLFAERTVKDVVLQLDVGWAVEAGLDPVDLITRHAGRTRITHFKPTAKGPGKKAILGEDSVDWPAVIAACRDAGGTEWMTVEQETYPDGRSPMDCTAASLAGLRKILAELKPA
ncbi:MAG: sugar phosphate isomerase/epimerase family protein [Planctomycetaceae bacterium]